jgi:release factor glutamine methyltransferase
LNKMLVEEALVWGASRLRLVAGDRARHEARLLLGFILKKDPKSLGFSTDNDLSLEDFKHFQSFVARRQNYEPISRIVGMREFWSLDFVLSPHTLDPRPDSEILVEAVLARLQKMPLTPQRFVDFGTGSGCLLIALLSERQDLMGLGVDKSLEALMIARRNAQHNDVGPRASFLCSSWGTALQGPLDFIISNPPYIPEGHILGLDPTVRNFDPKGALTPGTTGLEAYALLAQDCSRLLAPQGFCALEIGAGQEGDVTSLFAAQGFILESQHADLQGHIRCLFFVKNIAEFKEFSIC